MPFGFPVNSGDDVGLPHLRKVGIWDTELDAWDFEGSSLDQPVVFRVQPHPVEARHRVAYRSSVVVLVLGHFRAHAARLDNVHLLLWAMRTSRTRRMLMSWWEGHSYFGAAIARIDPGLQITMNLVRADGLVEFTAATGQRLRLTGKGEDLLTLINADGDLLTAEKAFLGGLSLTDAEVDRRMGRVGE